MSYGLYCHIPFHIKVITEGTFVNKKRFLWMQCIARYMICHIVKQEWAFYFAVLPELNVDGYLWSEQSICPTRKAHFSFVLFILSVLLLSSFVCRLSYVMRFLSWMYSFRFGWLTSTGNMEGLWLSRWLIVTMMVNVFTNWQHHM